MKQDLNVLFLTSAFRADRKTKTAAMTSDWLKHFGFFLHPLYRIQRNLTGSKISTSSTKFVYLGLIGKPPRSRIDRDISDFFSAPALQNSTKFDRKQNLNVLCQLLISFYAWSLTKSNISMSSSSLCFFFSDQWPPWRLIGWDIFDFFSATAEQNSTKLDRKQDPNVLFLTCVFRAYVYLKTKMVALASDWPRHSGLLLCKRCVFRAD